MVRSLISSKANRVIGVSHSLWCGRHVYFIHGNSWSEFVYKLRYGTSKLVLFLTYILCSGAVQRTSNCFMSSEYVFDVNDKVTHAGVLRVNFDLLRKLEII